MHTKRTEDHLVVRWGRGWNALLYEWIMKQQQQQLYSGGSGNTRILGFSGTTRSEFGSIIDYKTVEPFGCKMSTSLKYWLKSRIKTLGSDGSGTIPEIWVCTRHIPRVGGVSKLFCGGKLLYVGSTFSTPIEGNRKWKYVFMITPKWNSFDNILLSKQSAIKHIFHFVVTFLVLFEKLKYFLYYYSIANVVNGRKKGHKTEKYYCCKQLQTTFWRP